MSIYPFCPYWVAILTFNGFSVLNNLSTVFNLPPPHIVLAVLMSSKCSVHWALPLDDHCDYCQTTPPGYSCKHTSTVVSTHTYTHIHSPLLWWVHTHTHTFIHLYCDEYTHIHTHSFTSTVMSTHIYTHIHSPLLWWVHTPTHTVIHLYCDEYTHICTPPFHPHLMLHAFIITYSYTLLLKHLFLSLSVAA